MTMSHIDPPLARIRVVDLSTTVAGMTATMLLADLGADVIRFAPPEVVNPGEVMWHRNKRVVPPTEAAIAEALSGCDLVVTTADTAVLPEGFLAGNPHVIHLELAPLLPEVELGPMVYEAMLNADFGISRRQSSFHGGPVEIVIPFASYLQGGWGAASAVAAVIEREQSGRGQHVEVDAHHGALLAATTTTLLDPEAPATYTAVGPQGPTTNYSPYRCADGQWILLGAMSTKFQRAALEVLGLLALFEGPEFDGDFVKFFRSDRDWARRTLSESFVTQPRQYWLDAFEKADVPCGPLQDVDEWLDHPQMVALGQRAELCDPEVGMARMAGNPLWFSRTPAVNVQARELQDTATWRDGKPELPVGDGESAPDGPLAGLRVLDLGTVVAGPFAGRLLAGLGADVIKVEPLEGDPFRPLGAIYNRGHRSLAINLRSEAGLESFLRLVESADVVLDNFRPGVKKKLGIDHASLAARNAGIVSFSVTGFGGIGPIGMSPGFDPVLQAMSGMMTLQGGDDEPVFHTVAANDLAAGVVAVLGACAAIVARNRDGVGEQVSTSLASVSAYMLCGELVEYSGRPPVRRGHRDYMGPGATSTFYETADSWVRIHADTDVLTRAGLVRAATQDADTLRRELGEALSAREAADVVAGIRAAGGGAVRARTFAEVANTSYFVDKKYLDAVHRDDGRLFLFPGEYARFSRTHRNSALEFCSLGEHSEQVLREAGLSDSEVAELLSAGSVVVDRTPVWFDIVDYR